MASVHRFPARDCWRIAYTIYKEGKKKKRKSKYAQSKPIARLTAGQLEQLEEATRNGYAPKKHVEDWIAKGWLTPDEAGEIFAGYEAVLAHARALKPTDFDNLLKAYQLYWIEKTDRDISGKNLSNDKSTARKIIHWLKENCPRLAELTPDLAKAYLLYLKENR